MYAGTLTSATYIYMLCKKKHALNKLFTYCTLLVLVDSKLHFAEVMFYHNGNYGSRFAIISEWSKISGNTK